mmetsp:Transcript_19047/g.21534  ORF Transcript_19047/g.21534 Transcript_19047/m.21534 type:complete len:201 (+) Transcript_19047:606-1208(+)
MINRMVMGNWNTLTAVSMWDHSTKDREKVLVLWSGTTEKYTAENGKTTRNKAMEVICGLMVPDMKATGNKTENMVKGNTPFPTQPLLLEPTNTTLKKATVPTFGLMVLYSPVAIIAVNVMVEESSNGLITLYMKERSVMINLMVRVFIASPTGVSIAVNFLMVAAMDGESTRGVMELSMLVIGLTVIEKARARILIFTAP